MRYELSGTSLQWKLSYDKKCTFLFKYSAKIYWLIDTKQTAIVALQINRHKSQIDRSQTYTLLRARVSCAGRNCQDNINTEIELQRKWHTVLQVKGPKLLTVRSQRDVAYVARREGRTVCVCDNKLHLKASRHTTWSPKGRRSPVNLAEVTGSW
jgi:hypothetical protein